MDELTREQIIRLATRANEAKRAGFSETDITRWLLDNHGVTHDDLFLLLKALPPEKPAKPLSTRDLLAAGAEGATLGFADLVGTDRRKELEEMGHGGTLKRAGLYGGATAGLATGAAGATANIAARTGLGAAPQLLRAGHLRAALAQELSPSVGVALRQAGTGAARLGGRVLRSRLAQTGAGLYAAKELGLLDRLLGR